LDFRLSHDQRLLKDAIGKLGQRFDRAY